MATPMEASMFIMYIMFNMYVCACMCVYGEPPPTHTNPHPNTPTHHPLGGPPESVKIQ